MLSFSHGSIAIRANGLVAHVNAIPPARATPDVSSVGNIRTLPRRPITQMPATAPMARATSGTIAPGRVESTIAPPGPRQEDAGGCRSPARPHRAAEQEAGGDEGQAGRDRHVLEVDVGCPEPQRRRKDQRPGERAGERRAEAIASAAARAVTATTATIRLATPW